MWWSKKSDKSGNEKQNASESNNEKNFDAFQQARDIEEQQPAWKKPRTGDPEKKGPSVDSEEVPPASPTRRKSSTTTIDPYSRKQSLVPFYVDEQAALSSLAPPQPIYSPGRESPTDPFADQRDSEWPLSSPGPIFPPADLPPNQWGSTSTAVVSPTSTEFTFGAGGSFNPLAHSQTISAHR